MKHYRVYEHITPINQKYRVGAPGLILWHWARHNHGIIFETHDYYVAILKARYLNQLEKEKYNSRGWRESTEAPTIDF